jgi:putative phosphoribosyl transferase
VVQLSISDEAIRHVADIEAKELERRERAYRGKAPPPDIEGRIAILVDDGLATGATMRAAIAAVRQAGARRVVVAIPVAPEDTCRTLRQDADEVICPAMPDPFYSIGTWYQNFPQVTDEQVRTLLKQNANDQHFRRELGSAALKGN